MSSKTLTLDLDGKSVLVHRLNWKAARPFLKQVGSVVGTLYADLKTGDSPRGFVFSKLPEIVASSDELITALCTGSTNLTAEDFGNLDTLSAMQLLKGAMEINFDVEFANAVTALVAGVTATFEVVLVK